MRTTTRRGRVQRRSAGKLVGNSPSPPRRFTRFSCRRRTFVSGKSILIDPYFLQRTRHTRTRAESSNFRSITAFENDF